MRKILLAILFITFAVTGGVYAVNTTFTPSEKDFIDTISRGNPYLLKDGKPTFTIDSMSRIEGEWYIVTIKTIHPVDTYTPVRLVMHAKKLPSRPLRVVAGPDTHFDNNLLLTNDIPNSVIEELSKS